MGMTAIPQHDIHANNGLIVKSSLDNETTGAVTREISAARG